VSPRDWRFRIEDILDSINLIEQYTKGMDKPAWKKDRKTIDAVIRNIEIIGEAASHIPDQVQQQHPDTPWFLMKGMRNILIHEYFGVDIDVLWKTVHEDLPP
jgi:uncharacterized protein with HEPN domain